MSDSTNSTPISPAHTQEVLMLSSSEGGFAARSGYGILADYVPNARFFQQKRPAPRNIVQRIVGGILNRIAFSRWYRLGSARLEWRAWRFMRHGFEGVVHMMWADHDLGFLDLACRRRGNPLCGSFHNCPDTFPHSIQKPHRLRNFGAIILMSSTQRSFFEQHGVHPDKIHVVHHGVDTSYFRPSGSSSTSNEQFEVVSVGNYRRNFPVLREVCSILGDKPHIKLTIVAPSKYRSMFEEYDNVNFVCGISDAQLLDLYQKASCFLMTVEDATANNALLEAMACGLPVVAEQVGGIPEYTNAECALLCAPGDAVSLARNIQSLASNPSARGEMARAARSRAEELDWHQVGKRMISIYQSLQK